MEFDFTRSHIGGIGGCPVVGVDIHHHVHSFLRGVAVEVEITVVRHVDDGFLVGRCLIFAVERIVSGE